MIDCGNKGSKRNMKKLQHTDKENANYISALYRVKVKKLKGLLFKIFLVNNT